MKHFYGHVLTVIGVAGTACDVTAQAEVLEFTVPSQWQQLTPPYITINFTEFYPPASWITNQYASLGVVFDQNNCLTRECSCYENDGIGLHAPGFGKDNDYIYLQFTRPMSSIAVDFPGGCQFFLYDGTEEFYVSSIFPGGGTGLFRGVVSTRQFDRVILYDPGDGIAIDDLHFSAAPVATGACCLLNGTCEADRIEWGCLAEGGVYQGDGSTCDGPPCAPGCHEDTNEDGVVNINDLLAVITSWGPCPQPCPLSCAADVTFDCTVNITDLLKVIGAWGACQ